MADSLFGATEVAAVQQTLINSIVQDILVQAAIVFPTVNSYIAAKGNKAIAIPRAGAASVSTKSEGVAVDAQVLTYAADTLNLDQHKAVQYLVDDIAQVQANIDVFGDLIARAAKALALDMDDYVYEQLKLASAASPDHRIGYAGSTLAATDILEARRLLNVQSVPMEDRYLLINPTQEKEMLLIDNFVRADAYGNASGLMNGELGRIYGFRVLMSNVVDASCAIGYHKSACAFGRQIEPKFESVRDIAQLADRLSISHLFGAKVLDAGKRCVLIGTSA